MTLGQMIDFIYQNWKLDILMTMIGFICQFDIE